MELKFNQPIIVPLDDVVPYYNNTKIHPDEQVDKLAKQIAQGFDVPMVVFLNKQKKYELIKGHCRRLASMKLGLETVPVIVRNDLTPEQIKAARIADNKLSESAWDIDSLAEELTSIVDDVDLEDLGFSEEELNKLLSPDEFDIDEAGSKNPGGKGSTKEIKPDSYSDFDHRCPKCGFEFDD